MNKYRITLIALCVAICTQAKVTLPAFFTDNMVVQQKSTLILPGKAKPGKQVAVKASWDNRKYTAKAAAFYIAVAYSCCRRPLSDYTFGWRDTDFAEYNGG